MEPITAADLAGDLPRPGVLCTVAAVAGSAPQGPGAKMWVWMGGASGTVGGGRFEALVQKEALRLLAAGAEGAALKEFVLCREMGQCCGGRVTVLFEPCPRAKAVHLYGAGHVGRALAGTLAGMGLELVVVDPRPEWADAAAFPPGVRVLRADPAALAAGAGYGPEDAVCVLTHDHELDLACARALLPKPVGYLGLIGSEHKARSLRARLSPEERPLWDGKVLCPMGVKLASKRPKAVAISIAADLLARWAFRCAPGSPAAAAAPGSEAPA